MGIGILSWIVLSIVIGIIGSKRKIGFGGAFFLSLLLSPLIGLIFTLTSKDIEDEKYKEELLRSFKRQHNELNGNTHSDYNFRMEDNELKELKRLRSSASITEDEYQYKKNELMNH